MLLDGVPHYIVENDGYLMIADCYRDGQRFAFHYMDIMTKNVGDAKTYMGNSSSKSIIVIS